VLVRLFTTLPHDPVMRTRYGRPKGRRHIADPLRPTSRSAPHRVQTKRPGCSWSIPGPVGPLRAGVWPAATGANAPQVNAAVPQAQEPQGLAPDNNNSSRTSRWRSR